jgi:hypothetical protein
MHDGLIRNSLIKKFRSVPMVLSQGIVRLKAEVPSDYWYGILHGCASLLIIVIASLPKSSAIPFGFISASP